MKIMLMLERTVVRFLPGSGASASCWMTNSLLVMWRAQHHATTSISRTQTPGGYYTVYEWCWMLHTFHYLSYSWCSQRSWMCSHPRMIDYHYDNIALLFLIFIFIISGDVSDPAWTFWILNLCNALRWH
jgi:hypothetical protein